MKKLLIKIFILTLLCISFNMGCSGFPWAGGSGNECKCKKSNKTGEGDKVNKRWNNLLDECFAGMELASTPEEKLIRVERFKELKTQTCLESMNQIIIN